MRMKQVNKNKLHSKVLRFRVDSEFGNSIVYGENRYPKRTTRPVDRFQI